MTRNSERGTRNSERGTRNAELGTRKMGKAEISWKRRIEGGTRRELYARHVGDRWLFYIRERRFDPWQALPDPPLEDWLELLDGVQRRIQRRLLRPEEQLRIQKAISERFPGATTELKP
jgi:hypothetical protein